MKTYFVTLIGGFLAFFVVSFLQSEFRINLFASYLIYFIIIVAIIMVFFKHTRPKLGISKRCENCKIDGSIKFQKDFFISRYYQDDEGFNHEIFICKHCNYIHDVKFTFLCLLIGRPYRTIRGMTFRTLLEYLYTSHTKNVDTEIALQMLGMNEYTIEYIFNIIELKSEDQNK